MFLGSERCPAARNNPALEAAIESPFCWLAGVRGGMVSRRLLALRQRAQATNRSCLFGRVAELKEASWSAGNHRWELCPTGLAL